MEHKISNIATMQKLMSKLLWDQVEKWSECFEEQEEEAKARPYNPFLRWLEKAGRAWETVVAFGRGKKGRNELECLLFHANVESVQGRTCYSRGKEGYIRNACLGSSRHWKATVGGKRACYSCRGEGHLKREFSKSTKLGKAAGRGRRACYSCKEEGLFVRG